jgi:hypothetical protein
MTSAALIAELVAFVVSDPASAKHIIADGTLPTS